MTYQELGPNGSVPGKSREESSNNKGWSFFLLIKKGDFFRRWHGTMGWHVFVKYSTCVYFWVDPNTVCTCVSLFFSKLLSESLSLSKTLWPRCFCLTRKETTKSSFLDSMLKTSQESLMFPVHPDFSYGRFFVQKTRPDCGRGRGHETIRLAVLWGPDSVRGSNLQVL